LIHLIGPFVDTNKTYSYMMDYTIKRLVFQGDMMKQICLFIKKSRPFKGTAGNTF